MAGKFKISDLELFAVVFSGSEFVTGWTGKRGRKLKSKLEKTKQKVKSMARELYDDHFKAVESMPRGVVVTLRNISTQLESSWELHTNRQVGALLPRGDEPLLWLVLGKD